jgi:hypothetical protein
MNNTAKKISCQDLSSLQALDSVSQMVQTLPCLYSNNSTETSESATETATENLSSLLSPYHRKAAHALAENVSALINSVGLERIGFLTLTFPDNVSDPKEAYNRFRSLNSHYLASHDQFGSWICVKERQKRGAWHYHILIDCGADIRTGVNWDEIKKGVYRSANNHLRSLWGELRTNLQKYGFGRSELLPVRENGEAMSKYVGKYISKHIGGRKDEDKGVRLVSYSKNWPRSNANFQWHTPNSQLWRKNLKAFAEFFECYSLLALKERFGPRWAYHLAESIIEGNWPERLAAKRAVEKNSVKVVYPEDEFMIEYIEALPVDDRTKEFWLDRLKLNADISSSFSCQEVNT